jgi:probable F420-dependent oxidoreductase
MDDLRFGINIPQFHPENAEVLLALRDFAAHTESLGFDSLWTLDGIFHKVPFLEPTSSLAYLSAVTKTVKLGTAVLLLPLRPPALLAKFAATLDFLSSGRLILGVALGGGVEQFMACGVSQKERVPRLTESIKIMRMLWTESSVTFKGRFWQLEDATISPRPNQDGGIPIWMGGSGIGQHVNEKAIRRAAQMGDGWLGAGSTDLTAHIESCKKFVEMAEEFGRDTTKLAIAKRVYIHIDRDKEKAESVLSRALSVFYERDFDVRKKCVYGTAKECIDKLNELRNGGTKTLIFHPVTDQFNQAEMIAKDVIPGIV